MDSGEGHDEPSTGSRERVTPEASEAGPAPTPHGHVSGSRLRPGRPSTGSRERAMPEASEAGPALHQSATDRADDTARAAVDWRPGASDAGGE